MPQVLEYKNLEIGQQVLIILDKKSPKLKYKLEDKPPRFLVIDELPNNLKVLIPAFTLEEIRIKNNWKENEVPDNIILNSQNYLLWKSLTHEQFRTTRLLDYQEIYYLKEDNKLYKYNDDKEIEIQQIKLYNQPENKENERKIEHIKEKINESIKNQEQKLELKELADKLATELNEIEQPLIYYFSVNEIKNNQQLEINIKQIKDNLLKNSKNEEIKKAIKTGLITFDFTEETKKEFREKNFILLLKLNLISLLLI